MRVGVNDLPQEETMHNLQNLDFIYFLLLVVLSFLCVYICNNIKIPFSKKSEHVNEE